MPSVKNTLRKYTYRIKSLISNLKIKAKNHKVLAVVISVLTVLVLTSGTYAFIEVFTKTSVSPTPLSENTLPEKSDVFEYFCPEKTYLSDDGIKMAEQESDIWELTIEQADWIEQNCPNTEWEEENTKQEQEEEQSAVTEQPQQQTPVVEEQPQTEALPPTVEETQPEEPQVEEEELVEEEPEVYVSTLPVLKNLMINFGNYDPATGKAGSFLFFLTEDKVFLEFGAEVVSPTGPKLLPTFEYRTDPNASVFAVADGYVNTVNYQADTSDYEVLISPDENSQYSVVYDHIKNLTVSKGSVISAGHVLGTAGTWSPTLGRTELMVIGPDESSGETVAFCPFKFFDSALLNTYKAKVSTLMSDWETFKGDTRIYDESKHIYPGCSFEIMEG